MSCHGRHLGFDRTGNSVIRSADPENPHLERNMKWIKRPVAEPEIWPFEIRHIARGESGTHIFGEGEVVGSYRAYHLKEQCCFL